MTKRHLVIATRESPLALIQAKIIQQQLLEIYPELSIELLGITTSADKRLDISLEEIGGKGLFLKELEEALLAGAADIAVHSMKDVPMELPENLIIPVITNREDPRDAFLSKHFQSLNQLPNHARVGTSSLRRQTQIKNLRNDLTLHTLRGNVNTRLKRLENDEFDAIILASAGIKRLGLQSQIKQYFKTDEIIPAAGQGALGIECRADDELIKNLIAPLNSRITFDAVSAERALCRELNGGCKIPLAAFANVHGDELHLHALLANRDGRKMLRAARKGLRKDAINLGKQVAQTLIDQGALAILREFNE